MIAGRRTPAGLEAAMKRVVFALAILMLVWSPAMAARNARGKMVVHTDDQVSFSGGWNYCTNNPLTGDVCETLNPTSGKQVGESTVIWVVGAFCPTSSPGVTAFQFGVYGNIPPDSYDAWAPCGPGTLEIPDETWPASGTGTAVAFGQPVYPQFVFKMYWFATTAIAGGNLSTGAYPHGPMVAQFADDSNPPQTDNVFQFGTLRWAPEAGHNDCICGEAGACCFPDGHCEEMSHDDCEYEGGTYHGDLVLCNMIECPPPIGACCLCDGTCADLDEVLGH